MECRACSVSGWRAVATGVRRRGVGTEQDRTEEAPGRERMAEALNDDHGLTWRTSHQKCLV